MISNQFNIAIIGGGCSGLALAWELSKLDKQFDCTIFEKRKLYENDRTWCFWYANDESFDHADIVSKSWKQWSFSKKNDQSLCTHNSNDYEYKYIRSLDYYRKIENLVKVDNRFSLIFNIDIKSYEELDIFDLIIDTRPYSTNHIKENSSIFQIFYGLKIETRSYKFDKERVSLMESLNSNKQECEFIYILPIEENKALVELTSFSKTIYDPDELESKLINYIKKLDKNFNILEREKHILPMGLKHKELNARIIIGGMASNNLKTISGYGFLRSLKWAENTVNMIEQNLAIEEINKLNQLEFKDSFIDKVFIKVLRNSMIHADEIFVSMGKKMSSDSFARVMTDNASFRDMISLILSVPKLPFLRNVIKNDV